MGESRRVLVVCKGNYCRSPLAALLIGALSDGAIVAKSAGLRDWHVGGPAHAFMISAAAGLGYDLTEHTGAELTPELIGWAHAEPPGPRLEGVPGVRQLLRVPVRRATTRP
ncbi:arsenate reductase/protein-tyrosine-phosphatase family protein [Streptomyces sp. BE303]|uniref:arsenate reductase/protein-tyrosine-phosphatase family protein n=1 Tax=Streptomyces sp. BE303 TaxID=3002528 RepID=UPI003FA73469